MSYIIANGTIVAKTHSTLQSGATVEFSSKRVDDAINANRVSNLVNAQSAKIGNGAKWDAMWSKMPGEACRTAVEINAGEFFIS